MSSFRAALLSLLLALVPAATAAAADPDAVMSDNVEYLGSIKEDVGLTTGAKVVGDRLFVTSRQEHLDLRHLRPREARSRSAG